MLLLKKRFIDVTHMNIAQFVVIFPSDFENRREIDRA
jgi:hypothetical protein